MASAACSPSSSSSCTTSSTPPATSSRKAKRIREYASKQAFLRKHFDRQLAELEQRRQTMIQERKEMCTLLRLEYADVLEEAEALSLQTSVKPEKCDESCTTEDDASDDRKKEQHDDKSAEEILADICRAKHGKVAISSLLASSDVDRSRHDRGGKDKSKKATSPKVLCPRNGLESPNQTMVDRDRMHESQLRESDMKRKREPNNTKDTEGATRSTKKKRKGDDAGIMPSSPSYVFFSAEWYPIIAARHPTLDFETKVKLVGEEWKKLSSAARQKYEDLARDDKERWEQEKAHVAERQALAFRCFRLQRFSVLAAQHPKLPSEDILRLLKDEWDSMNGFQKDQYLDRAQI